MPEILTESFCERCGTRYTFESAAPRGARLKGMRVLSRGLKNFVMSDDSSLDEAMAAARSDTEREVTSQQLDAFHKTFNFCMQCRQYTCANCWNDVEGRCLTCAPHLGHEILAAPFPDLEAASSIDLRDAPNGNGSNGHDHAHGHEAALDPLVWPTADLIGDTEPSAEWSIEAGDRPAPAADAELDEAAPMDAPPMDAPPMDAPPMDAPPMDAADLAPDDAADALGSEASAATTPSHEVDPHEGDPEIEDRAAAAAAATARLLQAFRPGQSLDDALDAYERDQAAADVPVVQPDIVAPLEAAPVEAEIPVVDALAPVEAAEAPVDAAEAPVEAETPVEADQLAPETVASLEVAQPDAGPASPTPTPVSPPADRVEQPTWRIVAPDQTEVGTVGEAPASPGIPPLGPTAEPQWPSKPEWPAAGAAAGLPFLGRPATPTGGIEALWAESAREVSTVPSSGPAAGGLDPKASGGVQPCVSCGLSLSANARFCRRCGSRQG